MPCFSSHLIHCSVFKVQTFVNTNFISLAATLALLLAHSVVFPLRATNASLVCVSSQNLTILVLLRPDANVPSWNASIYSQKPLGCIVFGGDSRDRTGDLLLARQALSQLSYIPISSRQAPYPSPQRSHYVSLSPLPLLSSHKRFAGLRSGLKVRFD